MFSLMRSLTLRYLLQRWDRSILVALSISLGVATLVSARLLNRCVDAAAMDTTIPVDVADLYVHNGEPGVDAAVADELRAAKIPGIRRIEPFVVLRVTMPELGGRFAVAFGTEVSRRANSELRDFDQWKLSFTLVDNPQAFLGRPVAIGRRLYEERKRHGRADTDPVAIRYTNVTEQFHIVAVIDVAKDSPIAPYADNLILMDVAQAAKLMRRPGQGGDRLTRVDLFLEKDADVEAVRHQVETLVGQRANVRTPEANRKSTEAVIGGVKLIFHLCSLGALVIGLFLVYNALSVTVAERRHDIGVMRSLGATRGQIARLFAIESVILGAIGSLPGIPLGVALSELAISLFGAAELTSAFLNAESSFRPVLTWSTGIFAVMGGMITALLAALIPALLAATDEPADAIRRSPSASRKMIRRLHRLACIALVIAGLIVFYVRWQLPSGMGALLSMAMILIGLLLATPIFVGVLARLVHPFCRWFFGVEARLAVDNLIRSPARTGVVIGALTAAMSLMILTSGLRKSLIEPIDDWLREVIRADAFLFRGNMVSANSSMTPMEPEIHGQLRALPGVERVVGLRFYRPEYRGTFILMIAMDATDYKRAIRARVPEGLPTLDLMEKLPDGNYTIVSENFAARWDVKIGDVVTVPGPRGQIDLTVIGIGRDYSWSQGTIFVDRKKYAELFDDHLVDAYHVFFLPEANHDTTYESVRQYADREGLLVQNRESVRIYFAAMLDRIFEIAFLQQVIVSIVAVLGVVMALLISVLQRRRELGLLRAVGATQPQVLKSVLAEAMLMGLLGTILGFLMGLPMEWYLLRVVMFEDTGLLFDVLIPWQGALGIGLLSVATATIAGLLPALHAVRLNIPDAIAYE